MLNNKNAHYIVNKNYKMPIWANILINNSIKDG